METPAITYVPKQTEGGFGKYVDALFKEGNP